MDKQKGVKIPVQLRLNMWLGLAADEKKFNSFAEGTFSVYAEMVTHACSFVTRVIKYCSAQNVINLRLDSAENGLLLFNMHFVWQYENQAQVFGKWGTTGLVGRHKFSDVTGKVKLKRECFLPPRGWEWEGDWYVDPEKG